MKKKKNQFSYDLSGLKWDQFHRVNEQGQYCYCGGDRDALEGMLQCKSCRQWFHGRCLKKPLGHKLFLGDTFYDFECVNCSGLESETCVRGSVSWLDVCHLVIYHLAHTGRLEGNFARWREDICSFIDEHWDILIPKKKRTATWHNTLASILSVNSERFQSGVDIYKQPGWWALREDVEPFVFKMSHSSSGGSGGDKKGKGGGGKGSATGKDVDGAGGAGQEGDSLSSTKKGKRKKDQVGVGGGKKQKSQLQDSTGGHQGEGGGSGGGGKGKATVSDALIASLVQEDEARGVGGKASLSVSSSVSDVSGSKKAGLSGKKLKRALTSAFLSKSKTKTKKRMEKAAPIGPGGALGGDGANGGAGAPLKIVPMSTFEENKLLSELSEKVEQGKKEGNVDSRVVRFLCKLRVREQKRAKGMRVFSLDSFLKKRLNGTSYYRLSEPVAHSRSKTGNASSLTKADHAENGQESLAKYGIKDINFDALDMPSLNYIKGIFSDIISYKDRILDKYTSRSSTGFSSINDSDLKEGSRYFITRLMGPSVFELKSFKSPYTARVLKPYIYRDYESRTPKMDILYGILDSHAKKHNVYASPELAPIDYCYVRSHHIKAANALCQEFFWAGIDLTEFLRYPDFTVVVFYKQLLIGCAFMTPLGYITYIVVHPDWRRAGIGRFMLYHLIQTCHGKDITLHVSATNPAMLMYQEFGFKAEEYVVGFYDKYYPEEEEVEDENDGEEINALNSAAEGDCTYSKVACPSAALARGNTEEQPCTGSGAVIANSKPKFRKRISSAGMSKNAFFLRLRR